MAALEPHLHGSPPEGSPTGFLDAPALIDRLEEEVNRAARHGTALGCLLLRLDDRRRIQRRHGPQLVDELSRYAATVLAGELRRFDRVGLLAPHEFIVVLPGADAWRCELVARRVLQRLRAIKIEVASAREPISVYASFAQWREGQSSAQLISHVQAAAAHERLGFQDALGF